MEAEGMTNGMTLGELINTARSARGFSYERLSKACGGSPAAARLHQMENKPLKSFPDPDTIRSLARGTGFSVTEIIFAAARSLGLPVAIEDPDVIRVHGISAAPERVVSLIQELGREVAQLAAAAPTVQLVEEDPTQDMLDLAAHKGDRHIGPDELPYE